MPRRGSYHHGDLRRALVSAMRDRVLAGDVETQTLRALAREVGVTHAAAYRHFADKRALLAACAEEELRALAVRLRSAIRRAGADPRRQLAAIGTTYVAFALESAPRFRLTFGPRLNADGRFPDLDRAMRELLALAIDAARPLAGGDDDDARDAALALWTMAHGFAEMVLERRLHVRSGATALRYFRRLLEPFLAGLGRSR